MSRNRDTLKFFQSYIREMIDIGGSNLPKSISMSLGAKLGKILKEKGILGIESSLKKIYSTLKAKTKINTIDVNSYDVLLSYKKRFCPLGGKLSPERAEIIQTTICLPYTLAILNSINSELIYNIEIKECILQSNNKSCQYILKTPFHRYLL